MASAANAVNKSVAKNQPSAEFKRLAKATSATPPRDLNSLSAKDLDHLTGLIERSLAGHEQAIVEAEENIVNQAPRPLRGTVRRMLGAS
ncbi:MAG: hypothetical protein ACPGYP_09060 [Solirubrobacterales bacterium]